MLSALPDAYRSPGDFVKNADSVSGGLEEARLGVCISKELPGAVDAVGPHQLIALVLLVRGLHAFSVQSQVVNVLCFQAIQFCCNQVSPATAVWKPPQAVRR